MCKIFPQDKSVQIRSLRLAGVHAEEIKPQQESSQLIFHIHGGAFYLGSLNTHRAFMTQIAARTQMQVLHIDYPLAPESAYPEPLEALFDVYNLLLDQGIQAKDIILSGDSCGANLALALALKLQQEGLPQVSGLILLSPFLDLTLTSESLRYNQKHDALLSIETLKTGIQYYVPSAMDRGDPEISPFLPISVVCRRYMYRWDLKRFCWMMPHASRKKRNRRVSRLNSSYIPACGIIFRCLVPGLKRLDKRWRISQSLLIV